MISLIETEYRIDWDKDANLLNLLPKYVSESISIFSQENPSEIVPFISEANEWKIRVYNEDRVNEHDVDVLENYVSAINTLKAKGIISLEKTTDEALNHFLAELK